MNRFTKHLTAALLLIALVVSAVSACTPGTGQTTAGQVTSASKAGQSTTAAVATTGSAGTSSSGEKIKLTWANWVPGPVDKENEAIEAIEKALPNLELEMWPFERATWQDQINTRVAGGDIPDLIYRDSFAVVKDYVNQKILAEIPMTLVKENAPHIYQASTEFGLEAWLACTVDEVNYGLPIMQPSQTHPFTNGWRKDWLDKVGITKVPTTIAEYEEALTKFVKNDPDNNGQNDTFGTTFRGKDSASNLFSEIFAAYGVYPSQYMLQSDGTLKYGIVTDGARQAFETLNRWYKAGLIDPEFVTTDNAIAKQKWSNSKFGMMLWGTWYRFIPGGEFYESLKIISPNAEIVMGPAPKGPDGRYGYMNWGKITSSTTFGKQLATKPEALKLAMNLIDKIASDSDLYIRVRSGVEGVNWKRDPANNAVIPIAPFNDIQKTGPLGTQFFSSFAAIPKLQTEFARKDEPDLYKFAEEGNVINGKDYFSWLGMFSDPNVTKQTSDAALVSAQWSIDLITGAKPLDQFPAFVKAWEDAGGKLLTEDMNRAYKEGAITIEAIKKSVQ